MDSSAPPPQQLHSSAPFRRRDQDHKEKTTENTFRASEAGAARALACFRGILTRLVPVVHRAGGPANCCAVFDIDSTILEATAPAPNGSGGGGERELAFTAELVNVAREILGPLRIHLITARPAGAAQRRWTVDSLRRCGWVPGVHYESLTMLPTRTLRRIEAAGSAADAVREIARYKAAARKRVCSGRGSGSGRRGGGDHLVLNVGDQWSDLTVDECLRDSRVGGGSTIHILTVYEDAWVAVKLPSPPHAPVKYRAAATPAAPLHHKRSRRRSLVFA